MTTMQLEVYEAFRSLNVDDDKALKAAAVLGKTGDEINMLRADMNTRFAKVDVELANVKGELVLLRWMGGLLLTMVTAILFKLFLH